MLAEPKRRGRPATGQAMSAAERKRKQRRRAMSMVFNDLQKAPLTSILSELSHHVSDGHVAEVQKIATELIKRAQTNRRDCHANRDA